MAALEGVNQASALSAGIAEALITTAAGLIIAIPTMALYSYLNGIIDRNTADMSKRATELLTILESRGEF